ncbi:MAG: hypothetical protein ABI478_10770, partial [Propionivibrio sp.]
MRRQFRQGGGESGNQRCLILVGMQASDIADDECVLGKPEQVSGSASGQELARCCFDIETVVQALDAVERPVGKALPDF